MRPEIFGERKMSRKEAFCRAASIVAISSSLVASKDRMVETEISANGAGTEHTLFIQGDPSIHSVIFLPMPPSDVEFEDALVEEETPLNSVDMAEITQENLPPEEHSQYGAVVAAQLDNSPARPIIDNAGVWDTLAGCESTNTWDINTGNGYFGGLQMDMDFWNTYGGLEFASRPDLATKEQQIQIAIIGRDSGRGYDPWPGCADKHGLR